MIQNAFTGEPKVKPKTESQQQSDFTAEGAPPAGNAAQTLPQPAVDPATPALPKAGPPAAAR